MENETSSKEYRVQRRQRHRSLPCLDADSSRTSYLLSGTFIAHCRITILKQTSNPRRYDSLDPRLNTIETLFSLNFEKTRSFNWNNDFSHLFGLQTCLNDPHKEKWALIDYSPSRPPCFDRRCPSVLREWSEICPSVLREWSEIMPLIFSSTCIYFK